MRPIFVAAYYTAHANMLIYQIVYILRNLELAIYIAMLISLLIKYIPHYLSNVYLISCQYYNNEYLPFFKYTI